MDEVSPTDVLVKLVTVAISQTDVVLFNDQVPEPINKVRTLELDDAQE